VQEGDLAATAALTGRRSAAVLLCLSRFAFVALFSRLLGFSFGRLLFGLGFGGFLVTFAFRGGSCWVGGAGIGIAAVSVIIVIVVTASCQQPGNDRSTQAERE